MNQRLAPGLLALCAAALLGGCAAARPADTSPTAECPVCREEGDLACLNVHVYGDTPRAEYQGKTYYFCSDECREFFLKNPAKYAGR